MLRKEWNQYKNKNNGHYSIMHEPVQFITFRKKYLTNQITLEKNVSHKLIKMKNKGKKNQLSVQAISKVKMKTNWSFD